MLEMVEARYTALAGRSDEDATKPLGEGAWSSKQIIGHLIDSNCNNHQRFIRAQSCERLEFPSYEQDAWVDCQKYNLRNWHDLLDLWLSYVRHLVHVVEVMDEKHLQTPCVIGWKPEPENVVPLAEVIEHYWQHMELHLDQLTK